MKNLWRRLRRAGVWLGCGLALSLLIACSAPTPTPPAPGVILSQAVAKFNDTQTLHFVIQFSGQPTYLDAAHTLALRQVEGDLERPDKMRANVKASLPGAYVLIQAIGIGDEQFATNPLTGQWQKIPPEWGFNPSVLFQPDAGLSAILAEVNGLAVRPEETVDNVRAYHLAGQVAGSKIAPLTGWLVGSGPVGFELWIGVSDQRLYRVRLIDNSTGTETPAPGATPAPPAQWNMDLSQFDVPVAISTPQL